MAHELNIQGGSEVIDIARRRIESIDVVRGLIIVLMALDHTHDFFGNFAVCPTDLTTTTTALFFTRWIMHICAPTFFLLTGVGACMALKHELARFLVSRGLWLIFLELVVMRFALQFNIGAAALINIIDPRVILRFIAGGVRGRAACRAARRVPGWASSCNGACRS